MAGKFIVIEGSDGAGKTIQIQLLTAYLKKEEIPYQTISFPRYATSNAGQLIQRYLAGEFGDPTAFSPYMAALPYAMDRHQAKDKILKMLKVDQLVIADRYMYSNLAFQAAKLKPKERDAFRDWLLHLEFEDNQIPKEDLVLYLYVPVEHAQRLMASRNKDGHELNVEYQQEVEKEYLLLAKRKNWVKIDCVKNNKLLGKEQIHEMVLDALREKKFL